MYAPGFEWIRHAVVILPWTSSGEALLGVRMQHPWERNPAIKKRSVCRLVLAEAERARLQLADMQVAFGSDGACFQREMRAKLPPAGHLDSGDVR